MLSERDSCNLGFLIGIANIPQPSPQTPHKQSANQEHGWWAGRGRGSIKPLFLKMTILQFFCDDQLGVMTLNEMEDGDINIVFL